MTPGASSTALGALSILSIAGLGLSGLVLSGLVFSGCAAQMPMPREEPARVQAPTELPSYEEIAAGYNDRVAGLPRLWARTVGRIWYPDQDGRMQTEQVEGHLQYIATERLLLTFDKVSTTYALMGSNQEQYWWIERTDTPRAYIGSHSEVTPERIAEMGMPIYPRDVIELLGITPIPATPARSSIAWNQDQSAWIVTTPIETPLETNLGTTGAGESGLRRQWIAPATFEPLRIELLDAQGTIRVVSELLNYERISIPGGGPEVPRPFIPGEVNVTTADERTRMRLRIYEPESGRRRPRDVAFDLNGLLERFNVQEIISLDEARAASR